MRHPSALGGGETVPLPRGHVTGMRGCKKAPKGPLAGARPAGHTGADNLCTGGGSVPTRKRTYAFFLVRRFLVGSCCSSVASCGASPDSASVFSIGMERESIEGTITAPCSKRAVTVAR